MNWIKKRRLTVDGWTDDTIIGDGLVVSNADLIPPNYLYRGAQLNLLLSEVQEDGSWVPQHIVLDPDYLVDVTTICRCFTHYGDSPASYLLGKFMMSQTTSAILLGNAANQFLDDSVNAGSEADAESVYRQSLRKTFLSDPLRFAMTDGIDQQFSEQCRQQFMNIWTTVRDRLPSQVTLESAFLCEALGIQGRMDLMTLDHRTIWELKSGKANVDESYRYEHAMQMALYKESLYYNEGLPYAQVSTLLLYSRYPHLMDIRLGRNDIHRAIAVRNGIVHLEHLLNDHPERILDILTEQHFNTAGISDRFYEGYLRPRIISFLKGLHSASPLAKAYFHRMLAFVQREQFLAKTGIEGQNLPAGHHGFADTWRIDNEAKMDAGRLIPHLRLTPVMRDDLVVALDGVTTSIDESSNFRVGDLVMLYPQRLSAPANAYITCVIERLAADSLRLRLRYPQHDTSFLDDPQTLFAIEPSHADSSYTVLYRGLYAFLTMDARRQQIILGQQLPGFDCTKTLITTIANETLRDIVLRAKQAQDFFLLIGPPGTGKTSVALRLMVEEFLAVHARQSASSLLLMAFTNRAVDEICGMLSQIAAPYLRLGPELSCGEEHRGHLVSVQAAAHPTRKSIRSLLLDTPIIVGTLSSISTLPELFRLKHFSTAIIDEASQALEPHLLPLFCAIDQFGSPAIDKFILIGDHKQLPAVVVQSPAESAVTDDCLRAIGLSDCRRSFFERMHELAVKHGRTDIIGLLHRQGRMHADIADFVNRHYYEGKLDLVPLPHQTGPLPYPAIASERMLAVNVVAATDECTAKSNRAEARCVAQLAKALSSGFHSCTSGGNDGPVSSAESVGDWNRRLGIIVPFRGQITLVRRALAALDVPDYESITIDTVERFQGSQRDVILYSTVVHEPWQLPILSQPVEVNGQVIDRKLNVALTRAREQFVLIGDHDLLRRSVPYRQLLNEIHIATGPM